MAGGASSGDDSGLRWWQKLACRVVSAGPLPRHVAFIMDGNRRYARARGMAVADGHRLGYGKLEETLRWCAELDVRAVTCYAFSIENFKRADDEVGALMRLASEKLREMCRAGSIIMRQRVRVRVVGDLARVPEDVRAEMRAVMARTAGHDRAVLTICFSYTSRHEIAAAVASLAAECAAGKLDPQAVSAPALEAAFCTHDAAVPPVDLLLRTSGEKRLSDFLLWQSAHALTFFTPVRWPELSLFGFLCILLRYQQAKPQLDAVLQPHAAPVKTAALPAKALVLKPALTGVRVPVPNRGGARAGPSGAGGGASSEAIEMRPWQTLFAALFAAVGGIALASAVALSAAGRTHLAAAPLVTAAACLAAWIGVTLLTGESCKGVQHALVSFAASALAAAAIAVAAHRAVAAAIEP
jgi:ditrans,polycis-polyprenyl diphosphate synthase